MPLLVVDLVLEPGIRDSYAPGRKPWERTTGTFSHEYRILNGPDHKGKGKGNRLNGKFHTR